MRLIIEEYDYNSLINNINDINNSDDTDKVYKISHVLKSLGVGCVIDLARNKNSGSVSFFKIGSDKWEDKPFQYSTLDIADEIVNGSHRIVTDIWDSNKLKPIKQSRDARAFGKRYGWIK